MQIINNNLHKIFLGLAYHTISTTENLNDLWKLVDEIATTFTLWVNSNLKSELLMSEITDFSKQTTNKENNINQFVGLYRKFHGDISQISNIMNVTSATALNYKREALKRGLLSKSEIYIFSNRLKQYVLLNPATTNAAELDKSTIAKMEIVATTTDPTMSVVKPITAKPAVTKTAPANIQHREKVNLTEKLGVSNPAPVADNSEKTNSVNDGSPVWLSERLNLSEYWVYDYSRPIPTECGNCGNKCWATELWLVSRRLHKLKLVDAEFDSLDSLQDFLDPRKELAAKNNIYPLEKIDAELAGVNEKDQRNKCRAAKKQSQFSRFLEYYHEFHGDATKIAAAMGVEKQSVYSYKNKAKTMGVLK